MPVDDNWSDNFFEGPWIDLHLSFRSPSDVQREADAIVSLLQPPEGSRIVDIPCGPGDHVVELARRGYQVTGVDRSEKLLQHARSRAKKAQVAVELVAGDMRRIRVEEPFDALTCMWGSFGYFDTEGNLAQLETFRELLRPGGQLLLDLLPLEGILFHFEARDSRRVGRMIVVQDRRYDMKRQRIDGTWTFHLDHERIQRSTSMRLYTVREVLEMLEAAGFTDVTMFNPETLGDFELGASRSWVRGRRR